MADLDLWIDGEFGDESVAWHQEIKIDLDRLEWDKDFQEKVDKYVRQALEFLAKEIEVLGVVMAYGDDGYLEDEPYGDRQQVRPSDSGER